jgi:uncharacterized protein (DUF1330 family)
MAGAAIICASQPQPALAEAVADAAANATSACGGPAILVIDAYAQKPGATQKAVREFSARSGIRPLIGYHPKLVLEGGIGGNHLITAYKAGCRATIDAAMESKSWNSLLASLAPNPAQRITVFMPDPDNSTPSRRTASCKRPAYFVLKGKVSNPASYFDYLRALVKSGLLAKHGYNREVVMPGREVRLAWKGESFAPGEFFEILRFPCKQELTNFWNSPEYRAIVPLRIGAVRVDAWLYEP